jgi:hypothetical protein
VYEIIAGRKEKLKETKSRNESSLTMRSSRGKLSMSRGAAELVSCWLASVRKVLGRCGLWLDRDNVAQHLRVLRFVCVRFLQLTKEIFSVLYCHCVVSMRNS